MERLARGALGIEAIFGADLAEAPAVAAAIARHLGGLLSDEPVAYLAGL